MSDEPRYEPIDDDLPPPDPDDVRPATPKGFSLPANISKGMPPKKPTPPPLPSQRQPTTSIAVPVEPVEPEPIPAINVRLSLTLPEILTERMKALRAQAGIAGDVSAALPLTEAFSTTDEPGLRALLAVFEKSHLPLTLTLNRVEAEVRERQMYVAAWRVDAETQFAQLFAQLYVGLIDAVKPPPDAALPFEQMIVVGHAVPAKQFPALIAAMQRDFTPLVWRIEKIDLSVVD